MALSAVAALMILMPTWVSAAETESWLDLPQRISAGLRPSYGFASATPQTAVTYCNSYDSFGNCTSASTYPINGTTTMFSGVAFDLFGRVAFSRKIYVEASIGSSSFEKGDNKLRQTSKALVLGLRPAGRTAVEVGFGQFSTHYPGILGTTQPHWAPIVGLDQPLKSVGPVDLGVSARAFYIMDGAEQSVWGVNIGLDIGYVLSQGETHEESAESSSSLEELFK